ncbi:MAG: dephospho-CoA kinase [Rhodoluna sp.]|nr:dephospho-CoA kinase [Rhodoluna sp.]
MFLIGLTGGIAAGKSTVAGIWVALGAIEIDADLLAREVVQPGTVGIEKIRQVFGSGVFTATGDLDRKALGEIVFNNVAKRKKLEGIVHPLVRARAQEMLRSLPADSIVIYTVPLLVEANVELPFDVVVSVEAPETERAQRLVGSRGMTLEQALSRIKAQASAIERAARADYILNSNQSLAALSSDATKLFEKFKVMNEQGLK